MLHAAAGRNGRRAFEFGERVGLALSLVLWIAWVVGGAAAAWHSGKFLAPHRLAIAVIVIQQMPLNSIIGDIIPRIAKLEIYGSGRNPTAVLKHRVSKWVSI